jgi:hypothetical protein
MQGAPTWSIVKVWPATEISPVRGAVPVLAATMKVTLPFAVPLSPLVMEIHGVSVNALHPQPFTVVTSKVPVPPSAVAEWDVADSE